jgi:pyruvate formate lyase activating enzyme
VDACAHGALTVAGERMTTERVIARVAADKRFYDNSGGGVTFSGGEPFAQPAFLEDLLVESKRLGIHTAVETCGLADPVVVARCEPLVDLFLYDVKVVDRERHQQLTGMSNALILKNLRALAERARGKLAVRVPIIPGCTDDVRNVEEVAALLRSVGVRSAELMPYHSLGADKYASLGRDYLLSVALDVTARAVENVERVFATIGIECNVS